MRLIVSDNHSGTFNLVLEKYFLDNYCEDVFIIWYNNLGVYVGRNQNALEELDINFVNENGLEVFRRLSGGGTIFHDLNTIYYTFITHNVRSVKQNFQHYNNIIVDFLNSIGINAIISGRNDILVDGKKVSGSAEHYQSDLLVHHGSLLFNTNIEFLAAALTPNKKKFISKSVKSVSSRVDNLKKYCQLSKTEFIDAFACFIHQKYNCNISAITAKEKTEVEHLIASKYGTYEWNYGKSPKFSNVAENRFPFGVVTVKTNIEKGIINSCSIKGDFFSKKNMEELEALLIKVKYSIKDIQHILRSITVEDYIVGATLDDLLSLLI